MFRTVKGIFRLALILLVIFFAVSVWNGGEKFRWFGEKLGEKADSIKEKEDEAARHIKKLTGGDADKEGDLEQEKKPVKKRNAVTHETAEKKTKETGESRDALRDGAGVPEKSQTLRGGSDENKPSAGLWSTIWKKLKALTKE